MLKDTKSSANIKPMEVLMDVQLFVDQKVVNIISALVDDQLLLVFYGDTK